MNLDVFQMQQCEMQASLFESLDRREIDAKAFIRAFIFYRAHTHTEHSLCPASISLYGLETM